MSAAVNSLVGAHENDAAFGRDMSAYRGNAQTTVANKADNLLNSALNNNQAPTVNAASAGAPVTAAGVNPNQPGTPFIGDLMSRLSMQSQGLGPSVAQDQLRAATDANIKQQGAIAATLGSRNPALAMKTAANNAADVQQQAANQSAQTKVMEQLNAQQQLGQVGATANQQGLSVAQLLNNINQFNAGQGQSGNQFNAQLQQGANLANASNYLTNQGQNQGFASGLLGTELAGHNSASSNAMAGQDALGNDFYTQEKINAAQRQADAAAQFGAIGSAASGLATGGTATAAKSDERVKHDIVDDTDAVYAMLDGLSPKKFKYDDPKSPGQAEGVRHGIVAQDLAKSDMGKSIVKHADDGDLMLDPDGHSLGAVMSALAHIHTRLKAMEA